MDHGTEDVGWQSHDRAEVWREGGTDGRTQMDRDKGVRALVGPLRPCLAVAGLILT